ARHFSSNREGLSVRAETGKDGAMDAKQEPAVRPTSGKWAAAVVLVALVAALGVSYWRQKPDRPPVPEAAPAVAEVKYQPRKLVDSGGYTPLAVSTGPGKPH